MTDTTVIGSVRIVNAAAALYSVESATGAGSYLCDLKNRTCRCGDFQHRRSRFTINDPERLCKHQKQAAQAAPFLKAQAKAAKLSDAALAAALAKYGNDVIVRGACRVERARRRQETERNAAALAIFA